MPIRLPNDTQRTVLVGRTGTGKTVAGLWHLSNYPLDSKPWVAIDFKNDEHLNSIPNLQEIGFDYLPKKKDDGLFIIHALASDCRGSRDERSRVDDYLMRLWERENVGLFVDEAYVLGSLEGLEMCLTQGRSKHIPIILCTQRPAWVSRFVFSEASFIQCFDLNDKRDKQTVESFLPIEFADVNKLEGHESFYYDVSQNELCRMRPVPSMKETLKTFDAKLRRKYVRI